MLVTPTLLRSKHACDGQYDLFVEAFPTGTEVTPELCERYATVFDWWWAAEELLSPAQYDAYDAAVKPALDAYDAAVETALDVYKVAQARAFAEAVSLAP